MTQLLSNVYRSDTCIILVRHTVSPDESWGRAYKENPMDRFSNISIRRTVWTLSLALSPWVIGCAETGKIDLFNGKDLAGWKTRHEQVLGNTWQSVANVAVDPAQPEQLKAIPGVGAMLNSPTGKTCDIYSVQEFGDCLAHIEFAVPKGSNSGVYFQGAYEIQVFDSYGKDKVDFSDCGGIYARWINEKNVDGHAPRVNVSKKPGEWQSFDALFRAPRFDASGKKIGNARFVWVKHNGTLVHENVDLPGPTRAAMAETTGEKATGPMMLQGDHGPVAYRNFWVKPMKLK